MCEIKRIISLAVLLLSAFDGVNVRGLYQRILPPRHARLSIQHSFYHKPWSRKYLSRVLDPILDALCQSNYQHYRNDTMSSVMRDSPDDNISEEIPNISEESLGDDFSGTIWDAVCHEATLISEKDPKAATLMSNFIQSQPSFEAAVIDFVANQLETPLLQATSIRNLFADICEKNPELSSLWALDLMASAMRDSSQPNAVSVLLFNKGFHSLVTYRIANCLWLEKREGVAIYFQSLSSRTFGADIHPACKIGHSCSLSGATGVVIGETAVVGNECSILHDVTLGGNGKEKGDRHPKVIKMKCHVCYYHLLLDSILLLIRFLIH